jgi:diacylglycerol kinase (ATP)
LRGEAVLSEHPWHLAGEAAQAGDRLLVVVGGDGTVNEVVNGAAQSGAAIAVLPCGTGQDFGRTHGVPNRFDDAVRVALHGETRSIDLGRVECRGASRLFANVGSAGMSGAVARRANAMTKALGGRATFFYALTREFLAWQNTQVTVELDGGVRREGRMHDVIVANGRYLAGGMKICPEAEPDDGVFDVLLIGDLTKRDLLLTLPKTYRGTHLPHPKAEVLRGTIVTVDAASPLPVELDGEQPGTTPARFELVPRGLRVRVPRP